MAGFLTWLSIGERWADTEKLDYSGEQGLGS